MELLGLIYGIATVVVPLMVLSTTRAAVEYRAIGIHRDQLLRGAGVILVGSACWSTAAVVLLLMAPWSLGLDFDVPPAHAALAILPVIVGWIPGLLLLAVGAGTTGGTLDEVPTWARWMDGLWTA